MVIYRGNSFPALSKCLKLRYLDLSLVITRIQFSSLTWALRNLQELHTLLVPTGIHISTMGCKEELSVWPRNLQRLQLSGIIDPIYVDRRLRPQKLTSLTLNYCEDLSPNSIMCFLGVCGLADGLRRLTIGSSNRRLTFESIDASLAFIPNLSFLSVPGDLVRDTFFEILAQSSMSLHLRVLELGEEYYDSHHLGFSNKSLIEAIPTSLPLLRSVGFSDVFVTNERIMQDEELEPVLKESAKRRGDPPERIDKAGVYYLQ